MFNLLRRYLYYLLSCDSLFNYSAHSKIQLTTGSRVEHQSSQIRELNQSAPANSGWFPQESIWFLVPKFRTDSGPDYTEGT